jgi:uncharacterized protein YndB with AHSA1/START domain
MPLSTISTDDGALVVAWSLSMPAQAVWAGFNDPALLSQWLGLAIECDVRPGGRLVVDHGEGYLSRSSVTEAKEPHRLGPVLRIVAEPEDDGGDGEFGAVVGGAFGVAGGQIAELFESVEAAFDDVAVPVAVDIEAGWPASV